MRQSGPLRRISRPTRAIPPTLPTPASTSKAFIKGVSEALPNVEITFDPFHLIQQMNDALSKVRAEEAQIYPEMMKGSRYAYLRTRKT